MPKRKLALAGLGALALVGTAVALIGPEIREANERRAERERRQRAAFISAERRRLAEEQRPRSTRARPAGGLGARRALAQDLERAITRDARARAASGALKGPILRTDCESVGGRDRVYSCLAVRGEGRTPGGVPTVHGHPFIARIDYRAGTLTWCKTNPPAGEGAGGNVVQVRLSPACAGD